MFEPRLQHDARLIALVFLARRTVIALVVRVRVCVDLIARFRSCPARLLCGLGPERHDGVRAERDGRDELAESALAVVMVLCVEAQDVSTKILGNALDRMEPSEARGVSNERETTHVHLAARHCGLSKDS